MTSTRDKILTSAIDLFADLGYRGTSIGAIEEASGLAPRAGGFYRHFSSKEAVLVAALENYKAEILSELGLSSVLPLGDTRAELLYMGRRVLSHAARHRKLRLILRRDGRRLPAVRREMLGLNENQAYAEFLPWLEGKVGESIDQRDLKSLAVTLFSTLFYLLYAQDHDERPLSVDRDIILTNWATHWATYLNELPG